MGLKLSERIAKLPESGTVVLFDKLVADIAKEKKEGLEPGEVKTLSLVAGQPDAPTPDSVKKAACKAIKGNKTKYTSANGVEPLRQAIIEEFNQRTGLNYSVKQAMVGHGCKETLALLFGSIIKPGDCILVPRPCWSSFVGLIEFWGGVVVYYDVEPRIDFSNLSRLIKSQDVKGVILNSPNNPTGMVFDQKQVEQLAEIFIENDMWVVSDEVYRKLLFEGKEYFSIAQVPGMAERTVVVDGVSKSHSMTGWRIGYAIGPEDIITGLTKFKGQFSGNACSISQEAAIVALTIASARKATIEMAAVYEIRLNKIVAPFADKMNNLYGVKYYPMQGAFYLFIEIPPKWNGDCTAFCEEIYEKKKVGIVPGVAFGKKGWMRISFAVAEDDLKEGLQRILDFCQ